MANPWWARFGRGRRKPPLTNIQGAKTITIDGIKPHPTLDGYYVVEVTADGWPHTLRIRARDELEAYQYVSKLKGPSKTNSGLFDKKDELDAYKKYSATLEQQDDD